MQYNSRATLPTLPTLPTLITFPSVLEKVISDSILESRWSPSNKVVFYLKVNPGYEAEVISDYMQFHY